jgi:hypothetical protein
MRRRVRALWRRLREVPVVGGIVRAGDRVLWGRVIAQSGLVDAEFYAAQRGWPRADVRRSVADYVARGFRAGLSLNPLFDELVAGRALPEPDRVPALYAYLVSDRRTVSIHPWWDAPGAAVPDAPPPLDDVWARRADARVTVTVGRRSRSVAVAELRHWALNAARQWRDDRHPPAGGASPDLVVRLLQRRDRDYSRRVTVAAGLVDTARVVVAVVGCEPGQWVALDLAARLHPGLSWRRLDARIDYAAAVQTCADPAGVVGEGALCVVGPRSDLSVEEIGMLRTVVSPGRAVAPVELAPDGTVSAVGAAGVRGSRVYEILGGHPQEDLDVLGLGLQDVPLLSGPTFAMAHADWRRLGGFSRESGVAALSELTARAHTVIPGFACTVNLAVRSSAYARETVFTTHRRTREGSAGGRDDRSAAISVLDAAGFEVDGWREGRPLLRWRRPDPSALRWAVKICAPPGPAGAVWGDTHFAVGLADALRRRGQFVAVDSFDARDRTSGDLDDVTLVVRGPYRIDPPRTGTRVEWIISHPDQITRGEVEAFDLVYAASHRWSDAATRRWGVTVTPLLECTDAQRFRPRGLARDDEIVFVGTARGIARPSVVAPLAAGIPVRVYGPDWRTYIPAEAIVAESIPHSELSARYETASVVLNDQWPAMQREGFIAMRPFDVVAAGGRVISEWVEGIDEVFGDAVPVFRDTDELIGLLRQDLDDIFPDADALLAASERVRRDHSFDARAAELIEAVRRRRSGVDLS